MTAVYLAVEWEVFCVMQLPSVAFTEDFQSEFLQHYHIVFDEFSHLFLAGEMVWNFADFMTQQGIYK